MDTTQPVHQRSITGTDYQHIVAQHNHRTDNHQYSEKAKNSRGFVPVKPPLQVGNLVYLISDRDKLRARDRYLVVKIDGIWCFIKKFAGSQLRATSYMVKLSECYAVPSPIPQTSRSLPNGDNEEPNNRELEEPKHQKLPPSAPLDLIRPYEAVSSVECIPLEDNRDGTPPQECPPESNRSAALSQG